MYQNRERKYVFLWIAVHINTVLCSIVFKVLIIYCSQMNIINIINITNYVWLCYCIAKAIWVDFRQSFRGSIFITAHCIENHLMPNGSSGKDLQIIAWSLYIRLLTKCQCPSNCFSYCSSPGQTGSNFFAGFPMTLLRRF